jgi:hypothetical protein
MTPMFFQNAIPVLKSLQENSKSLFEPSSVADRPSFDLSWEIAAFEAAKLHLVSDAGTRSLEGFQCSPHSISSRGQVLADELELESFLPQAMMDQSHKTAAQWRVLSILKDLQDWRKMLHLFLLVLPDALQAAMGFERPDAPAVLQTRSRIQSIMKQPSSDAEAHAALRLTDQNAQFTQLKHVGVANFAIGGLNGTQTALLQCHEHPHGVARDSNDFREWRDDSMKLLHLLNASQTTDLGLAKAIGLLDTEDSGIEAIKLELGWTSSLVFVYDISDVAKGSSPSNIDCLEGRMLETLTYTEQYESINQTLQSHHQNLPCLSDRFRLARDLSVTIFLLHACGLFHRNLTFEDVLLIRPPPPTISSDVPRPLGTSLVLGHRARRPSDTAGPKPPLNYSFADLSVHPRWRNELDAQRRNARFVATYDVYSLGVLLLEVGLWRTFCNEINEARLLDLDTIRGYYFELVRKELPSTMGARYAQVVRWCLEREEKDLRKEVFYSEVVEKLNDIARAV